LEGHSLGDCVDAAGRLTHDMKPWEFAEQFPQAAACDRVVIRDQNTQRFRSAEA
jgi:hypothetical protein